MGTVSKSILRSWGLGAFGVTLVYQVGGASFSIPSQSSGLPLLPSQNYDMGDRAISSSNGNGPTTVFDHHRMELWFLAHPENTRLQQSGSILNSTATIQAEGRSLQHRLATVLGSARKLTRFCATSWSNVSGSSYSYRWSLSFSGARRHR